MPIAFYEGIRDRVVGNTDVRNESFSSPEYVSDEISVLPSCSTTNTDMSPGGILGRWFIERLELMNAKRRFRRLWMLLLAISIRIVRIWTCFEVSVNFVPL